MGESPRECVVDILVRKMGLKAAQVRADARLLHDLGIDGDDAAYLIQQISKGCSVDVSGLEFSRFFRPEPSMLSVWKREDFE